MFGFGTTENTDPNAQPIDPTQQATNVEPVEEGSEQDNEALKAALAEQQKINAGLTKNIGELSDTLKGLKSEQQKTSEAAQLEDNEKQLQSYIEKRVEVPLVDSEGNELFTANQAEAVKGILVDMQKNLLKDFQQVTQPFVKQDDLKNVISQNNQAVVNTNKTKQTISEFAKQNNVEEDYVAYKLLVMQQANPNLTLEQGLKDLVKTANNQQITNNPQPNGYQPNYNPNVTPFTIPTQQGGIIQPNSNGKIQSLTDLLGKRFVAN